MKKIITFLILFVCSVSLFGTEVELAGRDIIIKGTVKNQQNEPVPYATVMVIGTNIGIAANVEGEFQIKLNKGNYKLRVSCTGYEPRMVEIDVTKEYELSIVLEEAKNDLSEVVVTGTRSEKMLKDEPVVTRVITADDIKKIDPQDFKSLLEYELPGLHFTPAAHGSGLPAITFQGMDGQYLLFLIDGERIAGEGAADNIDFSRLNVDNIERIEIVKGAMSTLYGSNALGGVINIITKKANRPFVGTVSSRLTSRRDQKYSVSLGTRQEKFSSLTSFSYGRRAPFTFEEKKPTKYHIQLPDGRDSIGVSKNLQKLEMRGYETFTLSQKLGYDFTEKLSAEVRGGFYQNTLLYVKEVKKNERFRDFSFGGKVNYIFNENSRIALSYNYDNYYKNDIYSAKNDEVKTKYGDIINNVRLNYNMLLAEQHFLTVGGEMNAEKLKTYWFKDTTANSIQNYVLYAQDEYRITEQLSIVGGVRMDYHSLYKFHFNPKLSVMYRVGNVTLRGGYAAGFRSPTLKELYGEFNHGGMFKIFGSTDLKPETSHHTSLSGEWTSGIFNVSVTGYYNWFRDMIAMKSVYRDKKQKYPDYTYYNADSVQVYGADINMQLRFPFGLTLKGSYSYVYDNTAEDGKRSSYVRPHTAIMQAEYSRKIGKCRASLGLNGRWMSGVDFWSWAYVNKQKVLTKKELSDYMIWRLNASCRFPRGIALNIGVDNLFNMKNDNFSSDRYAVLSRGTELVANLSVNIAELIGK